MSIYQAKNLTPSSIIGGATIDATMSNMFSFTCQGSTTDKFNIKIYKVSDNTQVFTTGDIPLSPVKYNNETVDLLLPANILTNGIQYKWTVTTYEGANSATSLQVTFWANSNATFSLSIPSIINAPSYTITATYNQSNGVPLSYYYFVLSDSTGELERTDLIFSGNVTYTFSNFVNDNTYMVEIFGVTNNGYEFNSGVYSFIVSYSKPNINIVPTITQDCKTSLGSVVWGDAVQINGSVSGTSSYLQNYMVADNWALSLGSGSYYYADVDIPSTMNVEISYVPNGITNGKLIELIRATSTYEFGYNSTMGRFYSNIGGVIGYSQSIAFPSSEFIIVLNSTVAYVRINNIVYGLTY